jgi:hypothetical protein
MLSRFGERRVACPVSGRRSIPAGRNRISLALRFQFIKSALKGGRDNLIAHLFGPPSDDCQLVLNRKVVVDVFEVRWACFHRFILGQTFGIGKLGVYGPVPKLTLYETQQASD